MYKISRLVSKISIYFIYNLFRSHYSEQANKRATISTDYSPIIQHLKTKFIFDEPILRGFLAEANSIFKEVQLLAKHNAQQGEYLKKSHGYRSILRGCLEKLQKVIDTNAAYKDYMTIFYSIECIWHLCEIFLIDSLPSNHPVPHLIEWIRFHFPDAEQKASELLFTNQGDDVDNDCLSLVKSLIAQGHLEVARTILQTYARTNYNASLQMAEEILRTVC